MRSSTINVSSVVLYDIRVETPKNITNVNIYIKGLLNPLALKKTRRNGKKESMYEEDTFPYMEGF